MSRPLYKFPSLMQSCYLISYNMQGKEIDIEDIISGLNRNSVASSSMSFRISEDYQPNFNRYTREDQLQEINFDFINEAFQAENEENSENEVSIREQNELEKISNVVEETRHSLPKTPPKPNVTVSQEKKSLVKKSSLKASERLKRKISVKKESDQFTKKYDDLFDEIFLKQKQNEKNKSVEGQNKQPKIVIETSQESSSAEVKNDARFSINNVIGDAVISNSYKNLANQAVDLAARAEKLANQEEGFILGTRPIKEEKQIERKEQVKIESPSAPKVVITYETKILINIVPPKKQVVQSHNPMSKIKFSYGPTQIKIPSNKQIPAIATNISQQSRLPVFLVPFRIKTNSYPNFYNKKLFTQEMCEKTNELFADILVECRKAIKKLMESHLVLHEYFGHIKELYKLMSWNILNKNSIEDKELLEYFLSKDWASYLQAEELQVIRPRDYFVNRPFNELEFITLLNNFDEIIAKIEQETVLDAQNPETVKTYMKGRDSLWSIQKNLRLMAEDLYIYSLSHFNLPSHIINSYHFLKTIESKPDVTIDAEKEGLLQNLSFLKEKKDIFGNSYLGHYVIDRISQLKK